MATFQEWLTSLPSNDTLVPTPGAPRGAPGYVRGVPAWVGQNQVPAIWKAFASQGAGLIDQETLARLNAQTAGIGNSRAHLPRGGRGACRLGVKHRTRGQPIGSSLLPAPLRLGRFRTSTPSSSLATAPLSSISCASVKARVLLPA